MDSSTPPICITIPTYWGRAQSDSSKAGDAIFDHPTPIDGESTLPNLLTSLVEIDPVARFQVLVLVTTTTPSLAQTVAERVHQILAPYAKHFNVSQFGHAELPPFQRLAGQVGLDASGITLSNYAGVRNLQLLVAHALGSSLIIALDDDEVVPSDYLRIANETANRLEIYGAAGFYEDTDGSIYLPEPLQTGNIFQDKPIHMNSAARQLVDAPERWVPTPIAYGGNMFFRRELFSQVSFDPGITRGEDLDYVFNAFLAGFAFWLDKSLRITHMPPRNYSISPYLKLAEDVRRFIYQREKLHQAEQHGLRVPPPEKWNPYPGFFLQDDLENQAILALEANVPSDPDANNVPQPLDIVAEALSRARELVPQYFDFARCWPELMQAVENKNPLRGEMLLGI